MHLQGWGSRAGEGHTAGFLGPWQHGLGARVESSRSPGGWPRVQACCLLRVPSRKASRDAVVLVRVAVVLPWAQLPAK